MVMLNEKMKGIYIHLFSNFFCGINLFTRKRDREDRHRDSGSKRERSPSGEREKDHDRDRDNRDNRDRKRARTSENENSENQGSKLDINFELGEEIDLSAFGLPTGEFSIFFLFS